MTIKRKQQPFQPWPEDRNNGSMNKTLFGDAYEGVSKIIAAAIERAKPIPRFPEDPNMVASNCSYCGRLYAHPKPNHPTGIVFADNYCSVECYEVAKGQYTEFMDGKPVADTLKGVTVINISTCICKNCNEETLLNISDYCANCGHPITDTPKIEI